MAGDSLQLGLEFLVYLFALFYRNAESRTQGIETNCLQLNPAVFTWSVTATLAGPAVCVPNDIKVTYNQKPVPFRPLFPTVLLLLDIFF